VNGERGPKVTTAEHIKYQGLLAILVALVAASPSTAQTNRAIVGATLVDGMGGAPVKNAVVLLRDGKIVCAGPATACKVPAGAGRFDAKGMWIIPGLIDAHVHFSQTGWFDGRPDAIDLRSLYPYPQVEAGLEADPERFFKAYHCAGVTSVFDVGGYPWTWALRRRAAADPGAPRIAAAGPLLATVDHWLNLPSQQQLIYMASDSVVRATIRTHAAFHSDAVKIWYIMPPQPPDTARVQALVRVAAEEARAHDLQLIVHATGLWEAKDAIRAGARVLVHSVFESPVDSEFLALALEHHVIYVPTLMVSDDYILAARGGLDSLGYPLACVDSTTLAHVRTGPPVADAAYYLKADTWTRYHAETVTGMKNLKVVEGAGIPVAMGTDAGNPGTLHGPSVYREMELMVESGLTPMQVIVAATRTSALAMGWQDSVGTLEPGKVADLVILGADPTADIRNVEQVQWVVEGGKFWKRP
jgi:imidazolonepropionase-like amidohydrolase